jgi:hypothetical protein
MAQAEFVAYLGPVEIHDGVIKTVRRQNATLAVEIRGADGATIVVRFRNVSEVRETRAEGMMVYALAEYRHRGGQRHFEFANWEIEDDGALVVFPEEVTFQAFHDDG